MTSIHAGRCSGIRVEEWRHFRHEENEKGEECCHDEEKMTSSTPEMRNSIVANAFCGENDESETLSCSRTVIGYQCIDGSREKSTTNTTALQQRRQLQKLQQLQRLKPTIRPRTRRSTTLTAPILFALQLVLLLSTIQQSTSTRRRLYSFKHAPPRPKDAPPIDYGGIHPFDQYRHLYDDDFAELLRVSGGLRNLKNEDNANGNKENQVVKNQNKQKNQNKDKEKNKEEEKQKQQQQQQQQNGNKQQGQQSGDGNKQQGKQNQGDNKQQGQQGQQQNQNGNKQQQQQQQNQQQQQQQQEESPNLVDILLDKPPTNSPTPPQAQKEFSSAQQGGKPQYIEPSAQQSQNFYETSTSAYSSNSNSNSNSGTSESRQTQNQSSTTQTHKTTTLSSDTDHLYQPLRIQFDTRALRSQLEISLSAGDTVAATKLYLLIYEILPMTAEVWGDVLRVIPIQGGIYPLAAEGASVDVLLPSQSGEGGEGGDGDGNGGDGNGEEEENSGVFSEWKDNIVDKWKNRNSVYEDPVRALYCPDETTAGISGGADLLIYATVNRHCAGGEPNSQNNDGSNGNGGSGSGSSGGNTSDKSNDNEKMGTLASALSCQRDQYDRPITGSIDFCLGGMGSTTPINVASKIAQKNVADGNSGSSTSGGSSGASEKWDGWFGVGARSMASRAEGDGSGGSSTSSNDPNHEMVQYSVGVAIHEIGHVLGITSDSLAFFRHPITGHPLTPRPFTLSTVTCVSGQEMAYVGMPGPNVMKEGIDEGTGQRHYEVVTPTVKRVVKNHFNCDRLTGARLENQPTSSDCFGSHFDERLYYTEIMGAVFSQSVNILSPLTLAYLEDSGWYRANYQSEYVQISMFGHGAGCEFVENNCMNSNGQVPKPMQEQFCNSVISIGANNKIDPTTSGPQTCDPSHTRKAYCDLVNVNRVSSVELSPAPESFQYYEKMPFLRPYVFTNADYCPIPHLDPQSCAVYGGRQISDEQKNAGEYYGPDSRCVETDGSRSYSLCLKTNCNKRLGVVQLVAGGQIRTCEYDGQVHTISSYSYGDGPLKIKCPKVALVCPDLFCPANCAGRGDCVFRTDPSEPLAQCVCDNEDDKTSGCFKSNLTFPAVYGYKSENPDKANKTLFMIIVGSLIAGLAAIFIVQRQWKARQNVFM